MQVFISGLIIGLVVGLIIGVLFARKNPDKADMVAGAANSVKDKAGEAYKDLRK